MENIKKIVSYLLILSILGSGILYVKPTEIEAKTTVDNFDLSKYRANVYLKKGSVCNNIIKNLLKDDTLPSQVIVRDVNSKGFKTSVSAWEAAHLLEKSPYEIAQGEIDKKGYYEAILLSIFISESKMDNSLWDMGKTVTAETNQILSTTKSWVKKSDEIGMKTLEGNQKISKLSSKQKKELKNHLKEIFRKQHPALSKSGDIAEVFNEVFSSVDTVYDAVNKMAYYTNACELSNQTKNLIQLMYQDCPKSNPVMKEALRELKVSLDEFNSGVKAEIQSVAIDQASKVLSTLADAGWEKVINANPYVAAFSFGGKVGTKIGDSICNTLFSTDKTIEQYEKMKCLGEFHTLLSLSTQKLGKTYLKNRTSVNAENYFAAIDALFATANLSCKFGVEYADILYQDAALGWTAISNKSYTKFLSDIKLIQKTYADEQKSLVRNYLASLKVDYPAIYKTVILAQNVNKEIEISKDNIKKTDFKDIVGYYSFDSEQYVKKNGTGPVIDFGTQFSRFEPYLEISKDKRITYYFSYKGGDGTCELKGDILSTKIYSPNYGNVNEKMKIKQINGYFYIIQVMDGKTIYWKKSSSLSKKELNQKAHQAFLKQVKEDKKSYVYGDGKLKYLFIDLDGDAIDELITYPECNMPDQIIYTYKKGTMRQIDVLNYCRLDEFYESTHVTQSTYDNWNAGMKQVSYSRWNNGDNVCIASKSCQYMYEYNLIDRPIWHTFISEKEVSKVKYQNYVKTLKQGKKIDFSKAKWREY